jgi:hypothetical protein
MTGLAIPNGGRAQGKQDSGCAQNKREEKGDVDTRFFKLHAMYVLQWTMAGGVWDQHDFKGTVAAPAIGS